MSLSVTSRHKERSGTVCRVVGCEIGATDERYPIRSVVESGPASPELGSGGSRQATNDENPRKAKKVSWYSGVQIIVPVDWRCHEIGIP